MLLVDQLFDAFFGDLEFEQEDGTAIDILELHDALDANLEGD